MELARKKLHRGEFDGFSDREHDEYFCDMCLYGCFDDVPTDVQRIDLVLHSRPSVKHRLELRQRMDGDIFVDVFVDGEKKPTFYHFDLWLEKHMPKSGVCYLAVEYDEPKGSIPS